jgi:hypothetical protein
VGEGVADGPTESPEAERVEKSFSLISDSGGAVLKIFIVKAKPWIDPDSVNPCIDGTVDFATEVVEQGRGVVGGVDEVTHGPNIFPLDIAEDDSSAVLGDLAVEVVRRSRTCEVEDSGTCLKATLGNFGVVSFDRDEGAFLSEGFEDWKESCDLFGGSYACSMVERGFGSEIDNVGSFGT